MARQLPNKRDITHLLGSRPYDVSPDRHVSRLTFQLLLLLQLLRAVVGLEVAVVRVLDAPPQRRQPLAQRRVAHAHRARHYHHTGTTLRVNWNRNDMTLENSF